MHEHEFRSVRRRSPIHASIIPFEHYPEGWKRAYLAGLGGKSYQRNLLERDREAGLAFELAGYTGRTLDAMRGWRLATPDVLQVQLEAVMCDFDGALAAIFKHLGFSDDECAQAVELARPHDIARMSDEAVARNRHIHSRTISKWRDFLSAAQIDEFERRYGELIADLGYRLSRSRSVKQRLSENLHAVQGLKALGVLPDVHQWLALDIERGVQQQRTAGLVVEA